MWGLVYDEAADVASYHAAVAHVERTPAPSPVKAVMLGLRRYHIRTLRGAAPRSAEDGARARARSRRTGRSTRPSCATT